jgi:hypothetical protein
MTADVAACWILALPFIFAFYLAYGIVDEISRNRLKPAGPPESKPSVSQPSLSEPPDKHDWPLSVHRHGTPELFREDALMHIRQLHREVAEHERNIQAILTEMKKRERRDGWPGIWLIAVRSALAISG